MIRSITIVAECFLAFGLFNQKMVHCSKLDPSHSVALSNYFEARGFPFAWLTTDVGTCGPIPGVPGRILWMELLYSVLFSVLLPIAIFKLSERLGRYV